MSHLVPRPLLAFALIGCAAAAAAAQAPPASTVRVRGVVVDREAGAPVAGAQVSLTLATADTAAANAAFTRTTAEDGRFEFTSLQPGSYLLRIRRIGYRSLDRAIDVAPGRETELSAEIASAALGLEPLLVTATRPIDAAPAAGPPPAFGTRIDREQIELRRAPRLSDLLRSVPGLRINRDQVSAETHLTLRSGCEPAIFLDGLQTFSIQHLDATLLPAEIEAIDVFRGAETPTTYRANPCGAVLLHTRGRALPPSSRPFWFRLIAGAAFFTGVFLLLR